MVLLPMGVGSQVRVIGGVRKELVVSRLLGTRGEFGFSAAIDVWFSFNSLGASFTTLKISAASMVSLYPISRNKLT